MKALLVISLFTSSTALAGEYPVEGSWLLTDKPGEHKSCTTDSPPELQRERGMSYAAGVVQGYSMAMDCVNDPTESRLGVVPRKMRSEREVAVAWTDTRLSFSASRDPTPTVAKAGSIRGRLPACLV